MATEFKTEAILTGVGGWHCESCDSHKGEKMKIRALFRRTSPGDYNFSRLIGWWTKLFNPRLKFLPNYSHAELEFCDEAYYEGGGKPQIVYKTRHDVLGGEYLNWGLCFSSARYETAQSYETGVRFVPSKNVLIKPENWDYIEIEVTPKEALIIFEAARSIIGKGYDWIAILGFALPVRCQINGWWFCSEAVNWVLSHVPRILDKVYRWSPLASAGLLLDRGFGPLRNLATGEIVATAESITDYSTIMFLKDVYSGKRYIEGQWSCADVLNNILRNLATNEIVGKELK